MPLTRPEAGCGAVIYNERQELLLIQRLRAPEALHWGLPGGKIDFGEPVKTAVAREIREELGIEIEVGRLACLTETIGADDGRHWVAPVYLATILSGTPAILEPEKHADWGWFALDALPDPLTTPTQQYLAHRAALRETLQ
ncbi:MAG: NUDIX domain-containing protein [Pseudomonadota bacterium]